MKYYFRKNDERCYTKEYHLDWMKDNELTEMEVYEAVPEHGTGMFTCAEFGEIGEVGEGCGKMCDMYQPRNGKNGICKSYRTPYGQTDKKITLKLKP